MESTYSRSEMRSCLVESLRLIEGSRLPESSKDPSWDPRKGRIIRIAVYLIPYLDHEGLEPWVEQLVAWADVENFRKPRAEHFNVTLPNILREMIADLEVEMCVRALKVVKESASASSAAVKITAPMDLAHLAALQAAKGGPVLAGSVPGCGWKNNKSGWAAQAASAKRLRDAGHNATGGKMGYRLK